MLTFHDTQDFQTYMPQVQDFDKLQIELSEKKVVESENKNNPKVRLFITNFPLAVRANRMVL